MEDDTDISGFEYSDEVNVMDRLYAPCLKWAKKYVRDAGYFGSNVYRVMSKEILDFILRDKDNHITLVVNIDIKPSDYDAIVSGVSRSEEQVFQELRGMLEDDILSDPVKMLASIVAVNQMTVYVSLRNRPPGSTSLDHSKSGYFTDGERTVVFSGSFNETYPATVRGLDKGNKEHFHIFADWETEAKTWRSQAQGIIDRLDYDCKGPFPKESSGSGTIIVEISSISKEQLPTLTNEDWDPQNHKQRAAKRSANLYREFKEKIDGKSTSKTGTSIEEVPQGPEVAGLDYESQKSPTEMIKHRPHQVKALEKWEEAEFKGILKHATGSGKTITALAAIEQHLKTGNPVILIVPGVPLLVQWEEEIIDKLGYNIDLAIFGGGRQREENFALFKMLMSDGLKQPTLIMCTKDTFSGDRVAQYLLNSQEEKLSNILFIFDECHKAGEPLWSPLRNLKFGKALGLSATPERAYGMNDDGEEEDSSGNDIIYSLLGNVVHKFDLNDAITKEYLTKFEYHLDDVHLTPSEQMKYEVEREKMAKWGGDWSENVAVHNARRIVRGAEKKIPKAIEIISNKFNEGEYWLIYCATKTMVDAIRDGLMKKHPDLKRFIHEYHSKNAKEREQRLNIFRREGGIMLAMKCLDEGINIPNISHGIVLSSSTMEREFIQRRGRMLRTRPGKTMAYIYDVVCLPGPGATESSTKSIVANEIARVKEFGSISRNPKKVELYIRRLENRMKI